MATTKTVSLKPVAPNPMNVQQKKYYVFNETGNIMLASTTTGDTPIAVSVQQVFSEVAVFFAAMTKALSTTLKPKKKPTDPDTYYSLYDYEALSRIIDGSGLFVHVTEEDVLYKTQKLGAEFSKELISSLLGLATGTGEMTFASAMISSMGSASTLKIGESSSSNESKVSNIVFVCEYLLGMPIVSAIVVYADANQETFKLNIGPCFSTSEMHTSLQMHKDTYMFVTPAFIKEYAGDLLSIESTVAYNELVQELSGIIMGNPEISDIEDTKTKKSVKTAASLTPGESILISGMNFGPLGTVSLGGSDITITAGSWTNTGIGFTVPNVDIADASPVLVTTTSGKTAAIGSFTVTKKKQSVANNVGK